MDIVDMTFTSTPRFSDLHAVRCSAIPPYVLEQITR